MLVSFRLISKSLQIFWDQCKMILKYFFFSFTIFWPFLCRGKLIIIPSDFCHGFHLVECKAPLFKELILAEAKANTCNIFISPNRINLRINIVRTNKKEAMSKLDWLIEMCCTKGVDAPKTILFCNTMKDVATLMNHLVMKLGAAAFSPFFNLKIVSLVFTIPCHGTSNVATTALSIGINFPDIRYIINWGPARNLLDHHWEAGRAGRHRRQLDVVLIYMCIMGNSSLIAKMEWKSLWNRMVASELQATRPLTHRLNHYNLAMTAAVIVELRVDVMEQNVGQKNCHLKRKVPQQYHKMNRQWHEQYVVMTSLSFMLYY